MYSASLIHEDAYKQLIDRVLEQQASNESSSQQNANDQGLFALLSSVWDSIVEGAERIGSGMADAFLGFLNLSDFEIGDKIGWIAGTIIFEIVLAYLTAGAGNAIKKIEPVLKTILKFLDLGGEILGALLPLVRSAGRPVLRILDTVGGFARRIPGISKILDRIATAWRAIFRYTDEAAAATARAGGETAEAAGRRAAREVVEEGGERARRIASETAEETGERSGRETATNASEIVEATAAARGITELNDIRDTAAPILLAQLSLLKRRYRWIRKFRSIPKAIPNHYRIVMIASEHEIDKDYTTGFRPMNVSSQTAGRGGIRSVTGTHNDLFSQVIIIEGEVLAVVPRHFAPNFNTRLVRGSQLGLPDYQLMHSWGPGLGDEAQAGIFLGPRSVNIGPQKQMENRIASLADTINSDGGRVSLKVTTVTFPRTSLPNNLRAHDFLESIEYEVSILIPGKPMSKVKVRLGITAPPNGQALAPVILQANSEAVYKFWNVRPL